MKRGHKALQFLLYIVGFFNYKTYLLEYWIFWIIDLELQIWFIIYESNSSRTESSIECSLFVYLNVVRVVIEEDKKKGKF